MVVPKLARALKLEFFDSFVFQYFDKLTRNVINERNGTNGRRENGQARRKTDLLQILMEASQVHQDKQTKKASLSTDEMVAQAIMVLLASYNTTCSGISNMVYLLAFNQDKQEKVYQEIQELAGYCYDDLAKFRYLRAVVDETLRLCPSLIVPRVCVQDIKLQGISIPTETVIEAHPYALHRDPDYWTDPLEFKPERFLEPTHHPCAYMPFGLGPRNCFAQKFATIEMLIICIKLFSKFKFTLKPGFKIEYFKGNMLMLPKSVQVYIEARN